MCMCMDTSGYRSSDSDRPGSDGIGCPVKQSSPQPAARSPARRGTAIPTHLFISSQRIISLKRNIRKLSLFHSAGDLPFVKNSLKLVVCVFHSDGNSKSECSTDSVTCSRWYPSHPEVMHRLLPVADLVKDSDSWNHSDMSRDRDCVH